MMRRREFMPTVLAAVAAGCGGGSARGAVKAIVGGTLIDPGGQTLPRGVIVVAGSSITQAGSPGSVTVAPSSEQWNATGRFIIPAPIELGYGVPLPRIETLNDARAILISTPWAVEGMVSDSDELPPFLVRRLRDTDTVVVPRLARHEADPVRLERVIRHVKQLHRAGVRLAAFGEPSAMAEWTLLERAGLTPPEVLRATTVNAARAARMHEDMGVLRVGYRANLWVLRENPLMSVSALASVDAMLVERNWKNR
ncbi:MAG: amidohydrolase family protein [Acidobacteria bacterium]|nr:amidohydrolase family protein [Acidobacteriota bacterium]